MIISGGYNIAGPEIEDVLLSHPDVAECGVVGVPDEARGQIVKAYVILRDGATGDQEKARELQDLVKARIAPYKYPRAVEFVTTLPRTNTGKLQRFLLREQAAGRPARVRRPGARTALAGPGAGTLARSGNRSGRRARLGNVSTKHS